MTGTGRWVVVGLLVVGCGGAGPRGDELLDGGPDVVIDGAPTADAESGVRNSYVQNSLRVPTTPVEAQMFGSDLDGDPSNRVDNLMGSVLATFASQGVDIQATTDQAVADGTIVHLHTLTASGSDGATWRVFLGEPTTSPPDFSGSGMFTIAADSPPDPRLDGTNTGGHVMAGPGNISIQLYMFGGTTPLRLDLVGAFIDVTVNAVGCTGKLGGGILPEDIDTQMIPQWADSMNATVAADPGCPASCGASAQTLLDLFDADGDGTITADELRTSDPVSNLLPDIDLFDATGAYDPREDGVKDAVSLGIALSCVAAVFTSP
jgi:hypothetical protein